MLENMRLSQSLQKWEKLRDVDAHFGKLCNCGLRDDGLWTRVIEVSVAPVTPNLTYPSKRSREKKTAHSA